MNIGQAAQQAGLSRKMIRHYEAIGLLTPPPRTESGYRQYRPADIDALRFLRQARSLGFSTAQMGELLALRNDSSRHSSAVKAIAQAQLDALDHKLQELQAMRAALLPLVASCAGDDGAACGILEGLSKAAAPPSAQRSRRAASV
jgi:MerR family transcriptional regulator, copper efflux regulator